MCVFLDFAAWILSTGYALLSSVLILRLARFCRQTHSLAQRLQPVFFEWRVILLYLLQHV